MDTATINTPVFNDYWNVIKNWSNEMKAALISRLNESMKGNIEKENLKSWDRYFGSMKDNPYYPSAKELDEYLKDDDKNIEQFIV